jgi:hypothetical protein
MNDDQILLASAYVDHDVDDVERARAEADPAVMAEVARLRDLRGRLRDVDPPDPDRRERSVAAAVAAFGHETAPVAPAARPIPLPRRPRRAWWGGVAAAAAALVVVVAGTVAIRGGGAGDDSDDSAAVATDARAGDSETMQAAPDAAPSAASPAATDQGVAGATESASDATSATTSTEESSAASTLLAATGPTLIGPDELAAYASVAADSTQTLTDGASCTWPGAYVGPATYDGTSVEVFVEGDVATAVDVATCEPVVVVALPQ